MQDASAEPIPPAPFLMNPKHQKLLAGESTRIGNSYIMGAIALILLSIGVGALVYFGPQIQHYATLQTSDHVIQATVEDVWQTYTQQLPVSRVRLAYTVEGQAYETAIQISNAFYERVQQGMSLALYYDPSDPNFILLVDDDHMKTNLHIPFVGIPLFMLVSASYTLFIDVRNHRLSKGQRLNGHLVEARFTSARGQHVHFDYRFTTPEGKQLRKKTMLNRPDLGTSRWLPKAGTPVIVLYVNDTLFRGL